ncbi:MAG TPA: VWA domain-containing protein [Vicinamibacterales bacterium]|nr:VWA domain-containing protein [Vicinamibacterales bacterium]
MTRVHLVALSVVVTLAAALVSARAQQPVFRAGVPTVSIYATVVDPTGRLIPSLGRDDFEVYDNGKRQDLTVFANDVQPITLVMMLDRSQSMEQNFSLVRDAAEHFVVNLLPDDKVRLGSFSDRIQLDPQNFTSDKDELIRILRNNLQPAGATPLWNATAVAMTALSRQEGRRVVLLFTDGHDGPDFATRDTNVSLRQVRDRAESEGIMVYAIGLSNSCAPFDSPSARSSLDFARDDPEPAGGAGRILQDSGLWTLDPGPQRRGGGGRRGGTQLPGRGGRVPGGPRIPGLPGRGSPTPRTPPFGLPPRGAGRERPAERAGGACIETKPDPDLKTLTSDGGGGYFELKGADNLTPTFARIADELHHQYLLAYTVPAFDGKTHQIDVRVKQKNLVVRARKSYVAAAEK